MKAYVILRITVHDPEKLKSYQQVAPSIIDKFKGKMLARGGEVVSLEGAKDDRRTVMIEFESMATAKEFYTSPEYVEAIALRKDAASFDAFAVEGIGA